MRGRLTHIRIKNNIIKERLGSVIRVIAGIFAVFILCVSFSGYSCNIKGLGGFAENIFISSNPCIDVAKKMMTCNGAKSLACAYLFDYTVPLNNVLLAGEEKHGSYIEVGDISGVIGGKEYSLYDKVVDENDEITGEIELMEGDSYIEEQEANETANPPSVDNNQSNQAAEDDSDILEVMSARIATDTDKLKGFQTDHSAKYLLKNFYVVDSTTSVKASMFNVDKMLARKFTINKDNADKPQILLYHTHAASEGYSDSRKGVIEDGIIGTGNELARILREKYGYNVLHDKTPYDMVNGKIDRSAAYAKALPSLKQKLAENESIKLIIDLHRDGVAGKDKNVTIINGKKTARAMFFNGLSRNSRGKIKYLPNEYLFGNLAFSLQLKMKAMELYPDFTKPIYLKGYRYNLHLMPRSLLVELGNQNNTMEEAKNAMEPLADVIDAVLSGR